MYDKPIAKHYSYYGNKEMKQSAIASSLLEQTRNMDVVLHKQVGLALYVEHFVWKVL